MSKRKVLITEPMDEYLMTGLTELGFECNYQPRMSYGQCIDIIKEYTGLIISSNMTVDKVLLDQAKKLEFVARAGSGMESIDIEYADSLNVKTLNSPEGNRDAVGEHAIGMLLSLLHNINKADAQLRGNLWLREENRGNELQEKVVGILGFGNTGQAFSEKLSGFAVKIIAYDKYKTGFGNGHVIESDMETIFKETDILSLHLPLTEETHHSIDNDFLQSFNKKIYVLNTSRGKIVNTADLIRNLEGGKILGAALDVFENEHLETLQGEELEWHQYFIGSTRVILSPHIAGWTQESKKKIVKVLVEKIKSLYL